MEGPLVPPSVLAPPRPDLSASSTESQLPTAPWGILDTIPVFFMHVGFTGMLALFVVEAISNPGPGFYTGLSAVQSLALVGGVVFWLRYMKPAPLSALGSTERLWRNLAMGALVGVAILVAAAMAGALLQQIVSALLGHHVKPPQRIPGSVRGRWLWALGPTLVVFAPIGEEMFFRGFLYRALRKRFAVAPAVVISAAAFGLAHVYPLIVAVIFVDGVVLALLYERTKSLVACIAAHSVNNLIVFVVMLATRN
jgi:membrane protease YdiL (CAAX protease family)